jgi:cytochrome c-type biogenesis protein CcmH
MRNEHERRGASMLFKKITGMRPRGVYPSLNPSLQAERDRCGARLPFLRVRGKGAGNRGKPAGYPNLIFNPHQYAQSQDATSSAPTIQVIWLGILLTAGLLLVLAARAKPAAAQSGSGEFPLPPGVTWDDVNRVAGKMYCDVCEGIPLDECESIACRQWRQEIARQLSEGRTQDEIIDYFVQRYGDDVSAIPRSKSDHFLVFAVPVALVLLVGVIGAFQVNGLRRRGHQPGQIIKRSTSGRLQQRPAPEDVEPDYLERLEKELRES